MHEVLDDARMVAVTLDDLRVEPAKKRLCGVRDSTMYNYPSSRHQHRNEPLFAIDAFVQLNQT